MAIDIPFGLAARGPSGPAPERRPNSVRRTSTIDMRWPAGPGTQLRLTGRARDLLTPGDGGSPVVLACDSMSVGVDPGTRTIEEITADPPRPAVVGMVGARGGGSSRTVLAEVMAEEAAAGTPLYLLLDDIAGATLIAGFAYSRWVPVEELIAAAGGTPRRNMEGICTGFQPGSGALMPDGSSKWNHLVQPVGPLPRDDDPIGWHELDEITEISMRRARRIDVTIGDVIEIDSMFQDSSTVPEGGRVVVHEYRVTATADPMTGEILTMSADPRVLPYRECPLASLSVDRIVGTPLRALRAAVLETFPGTAGCTHLNDAMRAMAEVPVLVEYLNGKRDT
ncbi:DUF2889 domain-containing protein [Rhodococcus sp. NPDC003382]|uniref:DUF2889 domain-containing protein n=1 Tax=Rhodococcus sp. HM1 TaxID=2937759 RepID=UPI00200A5256|nr:DUF2889 domain-containing protein [Rhodococcus sp. HM1]MCK8669801.1 DUF2889 domain-containing protein [Rhodococcus sp. HM1]